MQENKRGYFFWTYCIFLARDGYAPYAQCTGYATGHICQALLVRHLLMKVFAL